MVYARCYINEIGGSAVVICFLFQFDINECTADVRDVYRLIDQAISSRLARQI